MDHSDTATGEEAKTEESEEHPSPAAKAAESAKLPLDTTKVPGHVDHSDTDATGEEAKTEESEEHSSPAAKGAESAKLPLDTTNVPGDVDHSDTDATAEAIADAQTASMTANPGNKEKKKGKKVFGERSSGDHAAVADDPDTSTDKSHHSSIEAFCSSDSDGQKQRSRKV
ncbi:uncharacterized protein LOC116305800 [Actinia tenebrosa]|uniref:Uncharacterized protein LOC116305800 n=1 Tax=Actinia tenebrosa TaxID=6105 RepID=A0A6P8J0C1_ACTTE|nr:uncharacterized protein LOC116305800 [Actinia tenebrosa]